MPKLINLTGKTFGILTAVTRTNNRKGKSHWLCRCKCGTEKVIREECLKRGTTKSCGCLRTANGRSRIIDLTGKTFGYLTVTKRVENIGKKPAWECRCICGTVKTLLGADIRSGNTKSCGCKTYNIISEKLSRPNRKTRAYSIWTSIKTRCRNPNCRSYTDYGSRGIDICDEWADSFDAFFKAVGEPPTPNHQIDRIDNERGYEPGNVRYVLPIVNTNNTRKNRKLTFNGVTLNLAQWARRYGMRPGTLGMRLTKYNWPIEKALTEPVRGR